MHAAVVGRHEGRVRIQRIGRAVSGRVGAAGVGQRDRVGQLLARFRHARVRAVLAREGFHDRDVRHRGTGLRTADRAAAERDGVAQSAGGIVTGGRGRRIGQRERHGVDEAFAAACRDRLAAHDRAADRRQCAERAAERIRSDMRDRADRIDGRTREREHVVEVVAARGLARVGHVHGVGQRVLVRRAGRRRRAGALGNHEVRDVAAGADLASRTATERGLVDQATARRAGAHVVDREGHAVGIGFVRPGRDRLVRHDGAACRRQGAERGRQRVHAAMRYRAHRSHRDTGECERVGQVVGSDQAAVVLHGHEVVERVLVRVACRVRTADALADHHRRRTGAGVRLAAERTAKLRRIAQAAGGIRAILRGAGIRHRVGHGVAPRFRAACADVLARHDRAACRRNECARRAVLHVADRAVGRRADRGDRRAVEGQRVGEVVAAGAAAIVADGDDIGDRVLVGVAGGHRSACRLRDRDLGSCRHDHALRTGWRARRWRGAGFVGEVEDLGHARRDRIVHRHDHRQHDVAACWYGQAAPGHDTCRMHAAVAGRDEIRVRVQLVGHAEVGRTGAGCVGQRDRISQLFSRFGNASDAAVLARERLGDRDRGFGRSDHALRSCWRTRRWRGSGFMHEVGDLRDAGRERVVHRHDDGQHEVAARGHDQPAPGHHTRRVGTAIVCAHEHHVRIEQIGHAVGGRVAAAGVGQRDRVGQLFACFGDAGRAAALARECLGQRDVRRCRRDHAVGARRRTRRWRGAGFVGEVEDLRNAGRQRIGHCNLHGQHQAAVRRNGQARPVHRAARVAAAIGSRDEGHVRIEHVGHAVVRRRRTRAVGQRDRVRQGLARLGQRAARLQGLGQCHRRIDRRDLVAVVRRDQAVDLAGDGHGIGDRCAGHGRIHLDPERQVGAGACRDVERQCVAA